MTHIKDNVTNLFPALSDFFESDKWMSAERFLKGFNSSIPAANVIEGEKEYRIELAIPGFKKEEVKVDLENEILTISAENKSEKEETTRRYTRKEFSYGSFSRSFQLPKAVNADKTEAKYENGVLKLTIPKKEEALSKARKEINIY